MRLFWRHGYEGVSIGDLTQAIGIAPPSLYAAFGSKAALYLEAVGRYEKTFGRFDVASIRAAGSLAEAVRVLLNVAVGAVTDPDGERGCLISSGLTSCHPEHGDIARDAAARRAAMQEGIAQALQPFADAGDIDCLSRHLAAVMQGISIQARDGVAAVKLQDIVEDVVSGVAARTRQSSPS